MPNSLGELSTDTLQSMKSQLQKWIVGLAAVDALIVVAFVVLLMNNKEMNVVPLIPVLLIPGLVMTPFLLRLTAVKKELANRAG